MVTKGQHTVPRLHLQHFAGSAPAGQVWTYDAISGRAWSAIPEETGVQTHFYSAERPDGTMDTRIEGFLAQVESNAAPTYEGLLRGRIPPPGQTRHDFAQFLALMHVRTTAMRRMAGEIRGRGAQIHSYTYASDPKAFEDLTRKVEAEKGEPMDPVIKEKVRQAMLNPKGFEMEVSRETRSKVADKAIAKRDAIASSLLDRRQNEYRKWAAERSEQHRQRIEQLGFPVRYLDAAIYIGPPDSAKPFVTLRQLAAVLFEQGKGVVSGFHFTNDDYGLSYKVPGARSSTYGFQLDGGELYLTRYMIGDDHEFLSSPWERALIQGQLTRLVEWPESWNAPSVIPQQKRSAIEALPSASQDKPASMGSPKFDQRFTPDEIAKRLDHAREENRQ